MTNPDPPVTLLIMANKRERKPDPDLTTWQAALVFLGLIGFSVVAWLLVMPHDDEPEWPKCHRDPGGQYLTYTYEDGAIQVKSWSFTEATHCND